jgi:hypothetical protein
MTATVVFSVIMMTSAVVLSFTVVMMAAALYIRIVLKLPIQIVLHGLIRTS